MVSPENPFFARMIANRLWSHYFGRGLVEPIDDMRATNPASNEPLLEGVPVIPEGEPVRGQFFPILYDPGVT